jgi:hypothetical protein
MRSTLERLDAPRAAKSSLTVWPLGAIVEFGATRGRMSAARAPAARPVVVLNP